MSIEKIKITIFVFTIFSISLLTVADTMTFEALHDLTFCAVPAITLTIIMECLQA
jgi:hypothetical protein